jgi:hypothetical protein
MGGFALKKRRRGSMGRIRNTLSQPHGLYYFCKSGCSDCVESHGFDGMFVAPTRFKDLLRCISMHNDPIHRRETERPR